jgi:hypothetical protein
MIIVYNLLTKENKLPFPVSSCIKQTEVCHFCFPFAANKWNLPFSVSSVLLVCTVCVCVFVLPFQTQNGSPGDFP